jgi:tRNA threonylcarbamoyladenosine biosynthesis protein TsaE
MKQIKTGSAEETKQLGQKIGAQLKGGELLVLDSDLGGGKTTFVKGLAAGMGIEDIVQSPTFTLEQVYQSKKGIALHHYDFYRLQDPGVLKMQLAESLQDKHTIVAVEWSGIVNDQMGDAVRITIQNDPENEDFRHISITVPPGKEYITKDTA